MQGGEERNTQHAQPVAVEAARPSQIGMLQIHPVDAHFDHPGALRAEIAMQDAGPNMMVLQNLRHVSCQDKRRAVEWSREEQLNG